MTRWIVIGMLALAPVLSPAVVLPSVPARAAEAAATAPDDVGRVWLRVPKQRGIKRHATRAGQLEFGDEALRFVGRKKTVELPFASMHTVSFGQMDGDVDTDWTVIELIEDGERRLYGLRDGRKLGFGQRTPAIHERIVELVRRHGAAQYGVPDDARAYDRFDRQFTTALPDGWVARIAELIYVGDRAPWGTLIFLPGELVAGRDDPGVDAELAARLRAGDVPAVTLERREAPRGAACDGFGPRAHEAIAAQLAAAPFGDPAYADASFDVDEALVDGCAVLRLTASGAGGSALITDAVVHDDVLYLLGATGHPDSKAARALALEHLRFAKAR